MSSLLNSHGGGQPDESRGCDRNVCLESIETAAGVNCSLVPLDSKAQATKSRRSMIALPAMEFAEAKDGSRPVLLRVLRTTETDGETHQRNRHGFHIASI